MLNISSLSRAPVALLPDFPQVVRTFSKIENVKVKFNLNLPEEIMSPARQIGGVAYLRSS